MLVAKSQAMYDFLWAVCVELCDNYEKYLPVDWWDDDPHRNPYFSDIAVCLSVRRDDKL